MNASVTFLAVESNYLSRYLWEILIHIFCVRLGNSAASSRVVAVNGYRVRYHDVLAYLVVA